MEPNDGCNCKNPAQYAQDNNKNAGIALGCIVLGVAIAIAGFVLYRYIKRRKFEAAKQKASPSSGSLNSIPDLTNAEVPTPSRIPPSPRRRPVPPKHGSLASTHNLSPQTYDPWPLSPKRESCHDATPSLAPIPEASEPGLESNCNDNEKSAPDGLSSPTIAAPSSVAHADEKALAARPSSHHIFEPPPVCYNSVARDAWVGQSIRGDATPRVVSFAASSPRMMPREEARNCYTPVASNPYEDELPRAAATPRIMPSDVHLNASLSRITNLDLGSNTSPETFHYTIPSRPPRPQPLGARLAPFPASYSESCRREGRRGSENRRQQENNRISDQCSRPKHGVRD